MSSAGEKPFAVPGDTLVTTLGIWAPRFNEVIDPGTFMTFVGHDNVSEMFMFVPVHGLTMFYVERAAVQWFLRTYFVRA